MIKHQSNSITVEEISSTESFLALKDDWHKLENSMPESSVFLTHEWFSSAWQWRRQDGQLLILVVWRKGEMIGAFPLIKSTTNQKPVKCTKLEYLAVPDSQECLILAKASLESEVDHAVFEYLAERKSWDIVEMRQIPDNSSTWNFLTSQANQPGVKIELKSGDTNPTVSLSGTWQEYYARRSRRLRKGNNHIANKLKRQFPEIHVEFQYYSGWPDDLLQRTYDDLIAMSVRSWKSQETNSSFDHEGPKAWLRGISNLAADNGWLAVWTLNLDGQCAATELQLIRNGIVHALRADFDNAMRDLSPGAYLNWKILEGLFSRDIGDLTEYRMGPGANPYKARWSERELQMGNAVFYNNTLRAKFYWLVEEWVKPKLRKTARRLSRQQ